MSPERCRAAVLCSVFLLALTATCLGVPEEGAPISPRESMHSSDQENQSVVTSADDDHHNHHHLSKRFIWTLTQEPYFYDKYGNGEEGEVGDVGGQMRASRDEPGAPLSPEMLPQTLPQALPLRNPSSSSLHKRLYPRWFQTYMYKAPSFNRAASPSAEHKRFQPFHPLARFRGLSLGGASSSGSPGYRSYDLPIADNPGHRLPTAPNAQPSYKYESSPLEEDEEENPVKVGELLHLLKEIAGDRGLSGHTKSFRFGISRRK